LLIFSFCGVKAQNRESCIEEPDKIKQYDCVSLNDQASETELAVYEKITLDSIQTNSWISRRNEFFKNYYAEKAAFENYRAAVCKFESSFVYYAIDELPAKIRQKECEEKINDARKKFLLEYHGVPIM
jgi:hypothetical protein